MSYLIFPNYLIILTMTEKLRHARVAYLRGQGYNKRVVKLFDNNLANSEDEYDPEDNTYTVKVHPARSAAVTEFAMVIDQARLKLARRPNSM